MRTRSGTPSARIGPVGSKRLFGVSQDVLPPGLVATLDRFDANNRFDTEVWASFTVCLFTRSAPGHMQFVCIESWRHVAIRERQP